ncbi:MAG: glutathione S-transferase family protein [Pseudomonadota bacterium]
MYTVIGNPVARTMRVLWMLEELGQDYDIINAAPHSDTVKQGNPGGKIPVLHDDEVILTDSVAIVTYLADKHEACTHPAGTPARGKQDAMTQFCVDEVEGALWTASKNRFILPEDARCPEVVPTTLYEFGNAMATLAAHVDGKDFIAGDSFTVPDLLMGHCAGWAGRAEFPIPEGPAADYMARMRERPAFARATARAEEAVA